MSGHPNHESVPEFSRLCSLDNLGEEELVREIEATQEERRALAGRLGLISLDSLAATVHVRRSGQSDLIVVDGHYVASVTQSCVVSLAPVHSRLAENFVVSCRLSSAEPTGEKQAVVDAVEEDPPETVGPEGLDLGEAVVQQLAIALDPYPRAAGVQLDELQWGADPQGGASESSPFAVLKTLSEGR